LSDTMDVRIWARENGYEIAPKGPIPAVVRDAWSAREAEAADWSEVTDAAERPADQPDVQPKRGPWWKKPRQAQEAKPRPARRRNSVEQLVGLAWEFGAFALAQNPQMIPMARCVNMQAPVAGIVIDDLVKGTVVDKVLQPLARASEKGEKLFGLVGPPLIVGAITAKPEMYPVLRPALKMSLMQWMYISEPAMKKAEKRSKDWEERFGGVDLDGMIDALFAPPEGYVPPDGPSEDEEAAIRRAQGM
jgi:hypothetical protein